MDSQPIAFEYEPFNPKILYFPTIDSHTGEAPDLDELVDTDNTFVFEHTGMFKNKFVMDYVHLEADVPKSLQDRKYRHIKINSPSKNGDTFISIDIMKESDFSKSPKLVRIKPIIIPII
jgi:hypothetical protein